jgi:tetratricopeptide (TPR) repeat protein
MTLENLGWIALARGDDEAAGDLQRRSLAIRTKLLGSSHRLVADSLVALAAVAERQQSYTEAEEALREALRIRREALGSQHLQVALCLQRLAGLLVQQVRHAEAEPLAREALAIVRAMQPLVPERVAEAERVLAECG